MSNKANKTVVEIVAEWLEANGYDGLFRGEPGAECGCLLSCFAPCSEMCEDCEAGYKAMCDDSCTHERSSPLRASDWHIQREKPSEEEE